MPARSRSRLTVLFTCLALGLLTSCGGTSDVPTGEDLFAALLTPSDLAGTDLDRTWRTDAAEHVVEEEPAPTPFQQTCPEVTEEPDWQASTAMSAQGLEGGRAMQLIEFVLAADPAATRSTYRDFTDALARCGDRQMAEASLTVLTDEDVDLGAAGDQHGARHITAVDDADPAAPTATDQYLAVVQDGPFLLVILTSESIPLDAWPGDPPGPSLTETQVAAVVGAALDRLSGRLPPARRAVRHRRTRPHPGAVVERRRVLRGLRPQLRGLRRRRRRRPDRADRRPGLPQRRRPGHR